MLSLLQLSTSKDLFFPLLQLVKFATDLSFDFNMVRGKPWKLEHLSVVAEWRKCCKLASLNDDPS